MEEIPCSKRRKIEETVVNILKDADLETATEYTVRTAAAQQLCADLSDLSSKRLIRQVIESFLLSTPEPISTTTTTMAFDSTSNHKETVEGKEQQQPEVNLSNGGLDSAESNGRVICKLSDKRNVAIHDFRGKTLVSIRDYYKKDGKQFPSGRGITLTAKQWSFFRNSFSAIEEAIAKMELQIRSASIKSDANILGSMGPGPTAIDQNRMETDISNSVDEVEHQRQIIRGRKHQGVDSIDSMSIPCSKDQVPSEKRQPQRDPSTSFASFSPQGCVYDNHPANFPRQSLVPIMTTRLHGKNYHCWMHQMEFFLNQLKVAYVLTSRCPSIPRQATNFEEIAQAKAAVNKWVEDEYICRHSILNSLSDNLFDQYSKKVCGAKELWKELKSVYYEDFGTRSLINNYIQFQMVDGVSILEQVEELHKIATAIMASGIWMDDNFHVSVIISKLPPSWKEYRAKLMREEFLPLNMLIHRIKVEEDSRNHSKKDNISRNTHGTDTKINEVGPKQKEGKRLCYTCGKEGHISKYCRDRVYERSNGKDTETTHKFTDTNVGKEL